VTRRRPAEHSEPIADAQAQQDAIEQAIAAAVRDDPRILSDPPDAIIAGSPRPAGQAAIEQPATTDLPTTDQLVGEPATDAPTPDPATEYAYTPAPGPVRFVFGPDGPVWPQQDSMPEIEEPAEPPVVADIPPDAWFGTIEGRLLAEGWRPPESAIRAVLHQREALRQGVRKAGTLAANDPGALGAAIRRAATATDGELATLTDEIVDVLVRNALDPYLTSLEADQDSILQLISVQLDARWLELMYGSWYSILSSLAGWHTPAAERLRGRCRLMATLPVPPKPMWPDYLVRRGIPANIGAARQ
jgi:hypothetical protein